MDRAGSKVGLFVTLDALICGSSLSKDESVWTAIAPGPICMCGSPGSGLGCSLSSAYSCEVADFLAYTACEVVSWALLTVTLVKARATCILDIPCQPGFV